MTPSSLTGPAIPSGRIRGHGAGGSCTVGAKARNPTDKRSHRVPLWGVHWGSLSRSIPQPLFFSFRLRIGAGKRRPPLPSLNVTSLRRPPPLCVGCFHGYPLPAGPGGPALGSPIVFSSPCVVVPFPPFPLCGGDKTTQWGWGGGLDQRVKGGEDGSTASCMGGERAPRGGGGDDSGGRGGGGGGGGLCWVREGEGPAGRDAEAVVLDAEPLEEGGILGVAVVCVARHVPCVRVVDPPCEGAGGWFRVVGGVRNGICECGSSKAR